MCGALWQRRRDPFTRQDSGGVYEVNEGFGKMHSYTIHEPVGVCALITPWNYPLLMGVWKLAPALAAGNSIIFKPASNCVLSSIKLFEVFEKVGMPKGSVNLVLGPGGSIGSELAENEDVDMITFTGSTEPSLRHNMEIQTMLWHWRS